MSGGSSGVCQVVSSNLAPATKISLLLWEALIFYIMYYVYVLYSIKDNRLYKGSTSNIAKRFRKHNSGVSKSTSGRKPFVIVHIEQYESKTEALKRERYIKGLEGGSRLKDYLKSQNILNKEGYLNIVKW